MADPAANAHAPVECPVPERFRPVLSGIVERIAAGDYAGLARDFTPYHGDPNHDLGIWARRHRVTFVPLPEQAWEYAEAFPLDDGTGWAVDVFLWSEEEGLSDMVLSAFVREHDGEIQVEITQLRMQ
jgi:hypothetical protein